MICARLLPTGNSPARPLLTDCSVESRCQSQFKQPDRWTDFRQFQCGILPGRIVRLIRSA